MHCVGVEGTDAPTAVEPDTITESAMRMSFRQLRHAPRLIRNCLILSFNWLVLPQLYKSKKDPWQ